MMDVALILGAPLACGVPRVLRSRQKTVNDRNSLAESVTDS